MAVEGLREEATHSSGSASRTTLERLTNIAFLDDTVDASTSTIGYGESGVSTPWTVQIVEAIPALEGNYSAEQLTSTAPFILSNVSQRRKLKRRERGYKQKS